MMQSACNQQLHCLSVHWCVRRFTAQGRNTAFTCVNCGLSVLPVSGSGRRNHCPACLHSLHVDVNPGDRASDCGGVLVPVGISQSRRHGWTIHSRCDSCGMTRRNRAALDDTNQPDDFELIMRLSTRPLPADRDSGSD